MPQTPVVAPLLSQLFVLLSKLCQENFLYFLLFFPSSEPRLALHVCGTGLCFLSFYLFHCWTSFTSKSVLPNLKVNLSEFLAFHLWVSVYCYVALPTVLICNSMFVYRHVSQPQLHSSTTWGNYQKYCYLTNSTFLKGAARHKYFFFFLTFHSDSSMQLGLSFIWIANIAIRWAISPNHSTQTSFKLKASNTDLF